MNEILGARIRALRESKGYTQEQVADKMKCSRQKYARIEKGIADISYNNIKLIAGILEVDISDITSAINDKPQEEAMFRNQGDRSSSQCVFQFINNMIDTFYDHRRLYNSVRQDELYEQE